MNEKLLKPWLAYAEPFCIFGNLYYVGDNMVSTHLIATKDGLILMDPGYPQHLYIIVENVHKLGFRVSDIRMIVCTHGHYDHLGAAKALRALCGGKIYLGAPDRSYANGAVDLTWAKELGCEYLEAFEPDVLLHPGDKITLGGTEILCKDAAGHTPSTLAFFFDVTDGKQTLRAGMHGGVGLNSMRKSFLDRYGLSTAIREQFPKNLDALMDEPVDINLGNHPNQNRTFEKAAQKTAACNPFIDPLEWRAFLQERKRLYFEMLAQETA